MNNEENLAIIKDAYENGDCEVSAEVMAELLMDDTNTTWKMFENLASEYINCPEKREGIDCATILLTGWSIATIAEKVSERMVLDNTNYQELRDELDEDMRGLCACGYISKEVWADYLDDFDKWAKTAGIGDTYCADEFSYTLEAACEEKDEI